MNILLDTNVLLVAIARKSKYRPIFDAFLQEKFMLCVSTDILLEYEEVVGFHLGKRVASNLLQLIENAINVIFTHKYYKWQLIHADPDDNKFVDCAVAANAEFIVSDDNHFKCLKRISFPRVKVITANEFLMILKH